MKSKMIFLLALFAAAAAEKLDFSKQDTYDAYFGSPINAEKEDLRKRLFYTNKDLLSYKIVKEFATKLKITKLDKIDNTNPFSSFVITNEEILTAIATGRKTLLPRVGKSVLEKLRKYLVTNKPKLEHAGWKLKDALDGFKIPNEKIGLKTKVGDIVHSLTTDSEKFFTDNEDHVTPSVVKKLSDIMGLNINNNVNTDGFRGDANNVYATLDTKVLTNMNAGFSGEPVNNKRVTGYLLANMKSSINLLTKDVVYAILGKTWNAPPKITSKTFTSNESSAASVEEKTPRNTIRKDGYSRHYSWKGGELYVRKAKGELQPINEKIPRKSSWTSPSNKSSIPMALGPVLILIAAVY